ncbi:hypothetical protein HZH66_012360 [Vespula vulgaris]|uniref:Uncharacterized protein n=1 Tax=Vespula vulgaris TaxID=7454 RepID=A0A834MTM4_VESVU|nr:hypothetical protein HZH66_012360 [Vespula vulgaris]
MEITGRIRGVRADTYSGYSMIIRLVYTDIREYTDLYPYIPTICTEDSPKHGYSPLPIFAQRSRIDLLSFFDLSRAIHDIVGTPRPRSNDVFASTPAKKLSRYNLRRSLNLSEE